MRNAFTRLTSRLCLCLLCSLFWLQPIALRLYPGTCAPDTIFSAAADSAPAPTPTPLALPPADLASLPGVALSRDQGLLEPLPLATVEQASLFPEPSPSPSPSPSPPPKPEPDDHELFCRLIAAEFSDHGTSYETKLMGATVVLNRTVTDNCSVREVILAPGQFSVVDNGRLWRVKIDADSRAAVDAALAGERNLEPDVYYFWADYLRPSHPLWQKAVAAESCGTVFAYGP